MRRQDAVITRQYFQYTLVHGARSLVGCLFFVCALFMSGCFGSKNSDETHFSRIEDIRTVDLTDARTLFVADVGKMRTLTDIDFEDAHLDRILFKYSEVGGVRMVRYKAANNTFIQDVIAPTIVNAIGDFLILGFQQVDDAIEIFETIIVRQSDGIVFYVGKGLDTYPIQSSERQKTAYVDSTGTIYYLGRSLSKQTTVGRIVRVADIGTDTPKQGFVGSASHRISHFVVGPDGLVIYSAMSGDSTDMARYYVQPGGEAVKSSDWITGPLFANFHGLYSAFPGKWAENAQTGQPLGPEEPLSSVTFFSYRFASDKNRITSSIVSFDPVGPSADLFGQHALQFDFGSTSEVSNGTSSRSLAESTILLEQSASGGDHFWLLSSDDMSPKKIDISFLDIGGQLSSGWPGIRVTSYAETRTSIVCVTRDLASGEQAVIEVNADGTANLMIASGSFLDMKISINGKESIVFEAVQNNAASTVFGTIDSDSGDLLLLGEKPFDVQATSITRL